MRRREFVGVAAALLATGCVQDESRTLSLEPIDDVADYVTVEDDPEAFEKALDDGHVSYGEPVAETDEYVGYEGAYYRATTEEVGTERVERQAVVAERIGDADDAVEIDRYGEDDLQVVSSACRSALESDDGTGYAAVRSDPEDTELLPEPEHPRVRLGNAVCGLSIDTREVEEQGYETTLEKVADDRQGFVEYINETYALDLDSANLSEAEREVLDTATEEGEYTETGESSEGFASVVSRLNLQADRRILLYDGEYYEWSYP